MTKKNILIGFGVLIVIIGIYAGSVYNSLVTANATVDAQWAQVQTQLQRRFDLIPNLVASVKGTLKQEQAVFGEIADARTRYAGATTVSEQVAAAGQVESALGRLLVIVENYPTLKSSETVQTLMVQIEGTENRISVERGRYNDEVRAYNVSVQRLPTNIFASMFGYNAKPYFEAASGTDVAPQVNL